MAGITPSFCFPPWHGSAGARRAGMREQHDWRRSEVLAAHVMRVFFGFALLLLAISDSRAASSFGVSIRISDTRAALSGRILDETDNGKTLIVRLGESVKVDLPAHGAGTAWRVVTQDLLGAPMVATATRPNALELRHFEFQAIGVGSTVLRLEDRGNPYEVKTFRATVQIEKP